MFEGEKENQNPKENLYEDVVQFQDFGQEFIAFRTTFGVPLDQVIGLPLETIQEGIKENPISMFPEEHFIPGWSELVQKHPIKVARINQCVALINECKDKATFGRAVNEIWRLIYYLKKEPFFTEEEYHPDKLEL